MTAKVIRLNHLDTEPYHMIVCERCGSSFPGSEQRYGEVLLAHIQAIMHDIQHHSTSEENE